jgi:hypothetical protein
MAISIKKYEEPTDDTHTFASKENHFPNDQLLRKHGFRILSRKPGQEAIWVKQGKEFTESGALKLIATQEDAA